MNKELQALQLENILSGNDQCAASRSEAECDAEAAQKLKDLNVTTSGGGEFTLDDMKKTKKKREGEKKMNDLDMCMEKALASVAGDMTALQQKEEECMKQAFVAGSSASDSTNDDDDGKELFDGKK